MRVACFIIGCIVILAGRIEVIDTTIWDAMCVLIYRAVGVFLMAFPLYLEFKENKK